MSPAKTRDTWRNAPLRAMLAIVMIVGVAGSVLGYDDGDIAADPALETGPLSSPLVGSAVSVGVPLALSSRTGAPYTIYLDFGGFSFTGLWGNNASYLPGDTPAYANDGDATTFSSGELANIKNVWSRVAEKFAWANVNVTTVDPAVAAGQAGSDLQRQNYYDSQPGMMHTVIGGNGEWTSGGGIGFVGVTGHAQVGTNGNHTDFVFSAQKPDRLPFVAEASAHENGHGLGLYHQSDYDGTTLVNEYSSGTGIGPGSKAPTMGNAYSAERGLWKLGTAHVLNDGQIVQNDIGSILNVNTNPGIAIADDGVGHSLATATPLPLIGVAVNFNLAPGVIAPTSNSPGTSGSANYSTDYWSFTAPGGPMSISAIAGRETITPGQPDPGGTLDATLRILDALGNLVAESATSSLSETISTDLAPGDYFAQVTSAADPAGSSFFDLGSYFLVGAVPEPPSVLLLVTGAVVLFTTGFRVVGRGAIENRENARGFLEGWRRGSPGAGRGRGSPLVGFAGGRGRCRPVRCGRPGRSGSTRPS
jgi:hypothetical protein